MGVSSSLLIVDLREGSLPRYLSLLLLTLSPRSHLRASNSISNISRSTAKSPNGKSSVLMITKSPPSTGSLIVVVRGRGGWGVVTPSIGDVSSSSAAGAGGGGGVGGFSVKEEVRFMLLVEGRGAKEMVRSMVVAYRISCRVVLTVV
jgi:hypothetical protein